VAAAEEQRAADVGAGATNSGSFKADRPGGPADAFTPSRSKLFDMLILQQSAEKFTVRSRFLPYLLSQFESSFSSGKSKEVHNGDFQGIGCKIGVAAPGKLH